MKEPIASGIAVVRVKMTDYDGSREPPVQLWAAALPRDEAVEAVMRDLPQQWEGELTEIRLTQDHVRRLNMKPGSVREISDTDVQDT